MTLRGSIRPKRGPCGEILAMMNGSIGRRLTASRGRALRAPGSLPFPTRRANPLRRLLAGAGLFTHGRQAEYGRTRAKIYLAAVDYHRSCGPVAGIWRPDV